MFAETKKEFIVEYSIDVVKDTLVSIFPVKYYKIRGYDHISNSYRVIDSFNHEFVMDITLKENSPNTTIISFLANYPNALMDLTGGGNQAIDMVLEKLLNQLDTHPKTGSIEAKNSTIEVVNKDNFVNTTKNKTHTLSIVVGYILGILSVVLPLFALINYDPDDFFMAMLFIAGILCLTMEISLSVILQYYENSESILHGRIQLCICGISLIILGFLLHPSLIFAGILIPIVAMRYFMKREKTIE